MLLMTRGAGMIANDIRLVESVALMTLLTALVDRIDARRRGTREFSECERTWVSTDGGCKPTLEPRLG